jgi:hypothetical protein
MRQSVTGEQKQANRGVTGHACVGGACPRVRVSRSVSCEWPNTVQYLLGVFEPSARPQIGIIGPLPPVDFICKGRLNMATCYPHPSPSSQGPPFPGTETRYSLCRKATDQSVAFAAGIFTLLLHVYIQDGGWSTASRCRGLGSCPGQATWNL